MIDLDNFKAINDSYGHSTGDAVLDEVSKVIRARVRAVDCAARIGGDEFAILFPNTPAELAGKVIEVLRQNIDALVLPNPKGPAIRLTCSIGVAAFNRKCRDAKSFLNIADQALYNAKAAGRNRVIVHQASGR